MKQSLYKYCQLDDLFIIKITGRATYDKCSNFKIFSDNLLKSNSFNNLLFDLTETQYIDSTNLGLIARLSVKHLEANKTKSKIISTNKNITDTILSTGLEQIIDIISESENQLVDWSKLDECKSLDPNELNNILIEAHETLFELNDKNKVVFKDVIEVLKSQSTNPQ